MQKLALLFLILLCCSVSSFPQNDSLSGTGIHKTWILINNHQGKLKGVLYEIKDSSVLVSYSLFRQSYVSGNFRLSEVYYYNIDKVAVRGKHNIFIGTVLGTTAGFAGAYGIARSGAKDEGEIGGLMLILGTPAVLLGATIGALIGSIRVNIPIHGKYELFKRNESRLEKYSYLREYNDLNVYEKEYDHKWYLGFVMGPSFPSGDFVNESAEIPGESLAKAGAMGILSLGYNFKYNFGVSTSYLNSSYNISSNIPDKWWNYTCIVAGPISSVRLNDYIFLDLKPMLGIAFSSQNEGNSTINSGSGPCIYASAAFRYNFSRRWCFLSETGYLFSSQKFSDGKKNNNEFSLGVGIGYRFK